MQAARLGRYNQPLDIVDVPDPQISDPHDVIVRIGGAGLCRTDLHIIEGIWQAKSGVTLPYTLGHENAGWVHAIGSSVTSVHVGNPVVIHPLVTDGLCRACQSGNTMHCSNSKFPGITHDGGFADYLLTSERAVIKLPPGLEPRDVAAFADAGLTAYHAVKKVVPLLSPGSTVAVIGIGGLGHIAIQVLKVWNAAEIIAVDSSPLSLELARELGVDHTVEVSAGPVKAVKELTGGRGVDAVIDFVGEGGVTQQAIEMLAKGGTYHVIGYGGMIEVPTLDIIFNEITVVGNLVGTYTELAELMTLAAQGKVTLRTKIYSLATINTALDDLHNGRIQGRRIIVP